MYGKMGLGGGEGVEKWGEGDRKTTATIPGTGNAASSRKGQRPTFRRPSKSMKNAVLKIKLICDPIHSCRF